MEEENNRCRSYCKCPKCLKKRKKLRREWRWNNIKHGLKLIFQSKPEYKVVDVRLSEILTNQRYDLADKDYEWKLLLDSIKQNGFETPIHLCKLRDMDPQNKDMELRWMQAIADGQYYIPLDGHHRIAAANFLALGDPLYTVPCIIIPEMMTHGADYNERNYKSNHTYFTSFHTPETWDRKTTDFGKIAKKASKKRKPCNCGK